MWEILHTSILLLVVNTKTIQFKEQIPLSENL